MAEFGYKAYDESGSLILGELEADDLKSAIESLKKDKLKPTSVYPTVEKSFISSNFGVNKAVTLNDLEFITAELSLLLESGVKIDKALSVLASAKIGGPVAKLLNKLSADVRQGFSLSAAMEKHEKVFDKLYVNLVKIGESSGNLPIVFSGLASDLKHKKELRSKIIQAITYPSVIFIVCICSILFIFNFVVPKLTVMFIDVADLPIYTEILLGVSSWIQNYQFYLGAVLILLLVIFRWLKDQGHLEQRFDDFVLSIPIIKESIILVERIRFTSSMALMLNSGVKLDLALSLSAGSVKNSVISRNLSQVNTKVRKGELITHSLRKIGLFSNLMVSLLEVGEESGQMAPVFNEISNRSRTEFSNWTDRMTSLIEPIMILIMGGIVGSVVVVMLMSIVSVNEIGF